LCSLEEAETPHIGHGVEMNQQATELQKQLEPAIDQIIEIMTTYGLDILGAIVILIIGF